MTGRRLLKEWPPFYAQNAWSAVRRLHLMHHGVSVFISGYTPNMSIFFVSKLQHGITAARPA
jgi:hypothetical protein